MTESLRKILNNPFLRENPFRPNSTCFSAPKLNESSSYSTQSKKYDQSDLSASYKRQYNKSTLNSYKKSHDDSKCLKKTSNPFYRKNLIKSSNIDDDFVQLEAVNFTTTQSKIKKSQYLTLAADYAPEPQTQPKYQDLSHKSSVLDSKNYLTFDPKNSLKYQQAHNKQNIPFSAYANVYGQNNKLGLASKVSSRNYITSPRFPSVKVIQNGREVDRIIGQGINCRQTKNDDKVYFTTEKEEFSSCKEIRANRRQENQPQRDSDCGKKGVLYGRKSKQWAIPQDGRPREINVKGQKYYRNYIELINK